MEQLTEQLRRHCSSGEKLEQGEERGGGGEEGGGGGEEGGGGGEERGREEGGGGGAGDIGQDATRLNGKVFHQ